nr:prion-like-(Q/N-rich) domain-bearing protein 25 [Onthophagus taurus]
MIANRAALTLIFSINFAVRSFAYSYLNEENVVVPCIADATCSDVLPGSKCLNYECKCMVENGCSLLHLKQPANANKIGETCITDDDCVFEHSKCSTNGICDCKIGWIPAEDKKQCVKAIPKLLGSECADTAQCIILNAICKNNTCQCSLNTHEKDGICYENKSLGESCKKSKECSITNSQCVKDVCQCKEGFITSEKSCFAPAKTIFARCTENVQCEKALGEGSHCLNSSCFCMEDFEFKEDINQCGKVESDSGSSSVGVYSIFLICSVMFMLYF